MSTATPSSPGHSDRHGAGAHAAGAPRARDEHGRARNDRPRDALGRPLPRGSVGVPRQPEGIERTPAETLELASALLAQRRPFHAHDVLEDHWKHTCGEERRLWRGLAQLAVGVTHAARGNPRGAAAVLARSADALAPFRRNPPHGIDVAGLHAWASAESERAAAHGPAGPKEPGRRWLDVPPLRAEER